MITIFQVVYQTKQVNANFPTEICSISKIKSKHPKLKMNEKMHTFMLHVYHFFLVQKTFSISVKRVFMKIKSKNERIMIPSFVYSRDSSTMVWEKKQRKQLILLKVVYVFV